MSGPTPETVLAKALGARVPDAEAFHVAADGKGPLALHVLVETFRQKALPQIRGLSLRQPWLWLVLNGYKNLENRKTLFSYRGLVALHASKAMTMNDYEKAERACRFCQAPLPAFDSPELVRGGFVGMTRVVNAIRPCAAGSPCSRPWHMHEQNGLVLQDTCHSQFIPYPGSLGFFKLPDHIRGLLFAELL